MTRRPSRTCSGPATMSKAPSSLLDDAGVVDTDGDGWREYNGQKLTYVATCPNGWSDWQAAIEVVAAAGKKIGIDITTNYPEWGVYQTVVTKSDAPLPAGYDIFMMWSAGAGPDPAVGPHPQPAQL
jgi:peptide/nickel transport system substrate-binding protein